jgi:F0F1-type ATP synthase delta subunit
LVACRRVGEAVQGIGHLGDDLSPIVDVDSELIGGIKVQVGDKVWDASVRGRLQEMAAALTK